MKKYIHYGHTYFDIELFKPMQNNPMFTKPSGGLWGSPIDATYGWKDWCRDNEFREIDKNDCFEFQICSEANVLHLYSIDDVDKLPKQKGLTIGSMEYLDFEQIKIDGYDAIELHLSEDRSSDCLYGLYYVLYGWDCDSILVMNPNCIVVDRKLNGKI